MDIELPVFEISGSNILNNFIAFPSAKNGSMKMKLPILVLLVKNVVIALCSWTNTSDSRWLSWTIRTWSVLLFPATTNRLLVLSLSNVRCLWRWMRDGTRLCLIWSNIARKPLGASLWSVRRSRCTRIADWPEFTSMIRSRLRTKYRRITNCSCACRPLNVDYSLIYYVIWSKNKQG